MGNLFYVAGVSTLAGMVKPRFAKNLKRIAVLSRNGHKSIKLVELPAPMSRENAIEYLTSLIEFKENYPTLIEYLDERRKSKASKASKALTA